MTIVDSSAWIDFLRGAGGVTRALRSLLEEKAELAITDVVLMEVLAGARDDAERNRLRRFLYAQQFLPVEGPADYESAAELHRLCRRGGRTPRNLVDCLIAVVAIRNDAELLTADVDFQVIARYAPLRLTAT
ncbi:MAG TPA: PIN domain nuclease [Solirubrobacterales bacterium]